MISHSACTKRIRGEGIGIGIGIFNDNEEN